MNEDYIEEITDTDIEDETYMEELAILGNALVGEKKLYVSDIIKDIDHELKKHQNKLFLIAGVGAGKSTWVKDVLAPKGNVLFITSRRAKVDEDISDSCFENVIYTSGEEHQTLITNAKLSKVLENMNLRPGEMGIDEFLNHYDYIVVDEVHSMVTDSTFANSSFGLLNFIEYAVKKKKKIICMTGTPEPVQKYFEKNKWYCRDLRKQCVQVRPKKMAIIRQDEVISIIRKELDKNNKVVYFVNSTDSIKKQYERLDQEKVVNLEEISVVVAEDNWDKLENDLKKIFSEKNKSLIEISKSTYTSIVEEKVLPENCKILLSTSKLREGVDIMNENMVVICDNHILTNIIQFCGRVRNGTEIAYIVEDATPHPINQTKILYKYSKWEAAVANEYLEKRVEVADSEFSKISSKKETSDKEKFIKHIENNPYCRFNFISNMFEIFDLRYKEETRLSKDLKYWRKNLIDYCIEYRIRPPFPYSWNLIVSDVLKNLYESGDKIFIHKDEKKKQAIINIICHLPSKRDKDPKTCTGLNKILEENKIPYYRLDSKSGGQKKKEKETYWYVKELKSTDKK